MAGVDEVRSGRADVLSRHKLVKHGAEIAVEAVRLRSDGANWESATSSRDSHGVYFTGVTRMGAPVVLAQSTGA